MGIGNSFNQAGHPTHQFTASLQILHNPTWLSKSLKYICLTSCMRIILYSYSYIFVFFLGQNFITDPGDKTIRPFTSAAFVAASFRQQQNSLHDTWHSFFIQITQFTFWKYKVLRQHLVHCARPKSYQKLSWTHWIP